MRRELLIAASPGEWRAAWLEDGVPVELHVERGDAAPAGSLHLGRVVRLVGSLDAALVDIGDGRPGFLPSRSLPLEGARVIVEVRREAQRGKGALLSTRIAPERLARIAGLAAAGDPPMRLDPLLGFAPALASRLPGRPDRVLANDAALLPELRRAFSDVEIALLEETEWPADLDALFDAALAPSLSLPGGGSIHIEESRAAVLVDVDTGSPEAGSVEQTALSANLAAAAVLARQIRLRQLGGGIVIDFAALEGRRARERVREAVAAALAGDPAHPEVLGWTRLGHLEIVRPRRLRPLGDALLEPQGARKNAVTLAFEAMRLLAREARANPAANWRLVVADDIAAALAHARPPAAALRGLEERLRRKIALEARPASTVPPFDIVPL